MDQSARDLIASLRAQSSSEGADWLLENYPVGSSSWGIALNAIEHTSFEKPDLTRLAQHYLSRLPYASGHPYEVFVRLLGVRRFLAVISPIIPAEPSDRSLLLYYLLPAIRQAATSEDERKAVEAFVAEAG